MSERDAIEQILNKAKECLDGPALDLDAIKAMEASNDICWHPQARSVVRALIKMVEDGDVLIKAQAEDYEECLRKRDERIVNLLAVLIDTHLYLDKDYPNKVAFMVGEIAAAIGPDPHDWPLTKAKETERGLREALEQTRVYLQLVYEKSDGHTDTIDAKRKLKRMLAALASEVPCAKEEKT